MSNSKLLMAASAAASLLAAAGAANAATVGTASATVNSLTTLGSGTSLTTVESGGGSGTGSLDSSGAFTLNATIIAAINPNFTGGTPTTLTISDTDVFQGTTAANVYTATGGSQTVNSCTGSAAFCPAAGTNNFKQFSGTVSLLAGGGGTLTGTSHPQGTSSTNAWTISNFTPSGGNPPPPPVPLPPAVWLLGSGLLGLVGTARRRLTVSTK